MIGDLIVVALTLSIIGQGIVSKKMKWWGAIGIVIVLYNVFVDRGLVGEPVNTSRFWLGLLLWMVFWSAWK